MAGRVTILDFGDIFADRTVASGQQQQLAIARAMVGNPAPMRLNEPSERIQPPFAKDIARHVRTLNDLTGVSVFLVELNLDLIMSLAGRGYVTERGRLVASLGTDVTSSYDVVSMSEGLAAEWPKQ